MSIFDHHTRPKSWHSSLLLFLRSYPIIFLAWSVAAQQTVFAQQNSLPSGGTFAVGRGSISASSNTLTVNQGSTRGIIDWRSFSIGQGNSVLFNNRAGATLNRVTGGQMSSIVGSLTSTGSVYLINPAGVIVGPSGQIRTGGDFVASTLTLSNDAFLKGGSFLFVGPSSAIVKNLGLISSTGGSVFLIARSVENHGTLSSPNGSVGLAAGQEVLLKDASNDERVFVHAGSGDVKNSGTIAAAEAELKAADGNIYALAGNNQGQIRATGTATRDGHVWLISNGGTTSVAGSVSAQGANGSGGFIETSGHSFSLDNPTISTGNGGSWLVDPVDLTVDSSAASTIQSSLNSGTNVTLTTTATGASGPGTQSSGSGNINVANSIGWSTGSSLTLSAYKDINIQTGVTLSNTGAGSLTLQADNAANGNGTINFIDTGRVNFSGSSGNVSLFYHPSAYPTATDFSSKVTMGSGTSTPYMTVDNVADLQNINNNNAGIYALNKDIDASSVANFTPLGGQTNWTNTPDSGGFSGLFNGQGHVISGLTINENSGANGANGGLFSQVGTSGIVRNLGVTGASITSSSPASTIGVIAGYNYGTIVNTYSTGTVSLPGGSQNYLGGLVGGNDGTISASYSSANVSISSGAGHFVGGLAGTNGYYYSNSSINNSYATGSVNSGSSSSYTGGLVGNNDAVISSSYSTGSVTGSTGNIGGLIGHTYGGASVTNSYWDTQTSGRSTSIAGTGLTTAQLKNGSFPSGFSPAAWNVTSGAYPLLSWQQILVSGTVYNGASPLASQSVGLLFAGNSLGTVTTNASGFYSLSVSPSVSSILAYLTAGSYKGNTFSDGGGSGSFSGVNIYTNTLRIIDKTHTAFTGMVNALGTTLGGNAGSDYLFGASGGVLTLSNGTNFQLASTASSLTIDSPISSTGTALITATGNLALGSSGTIDASGTGNSLTLSTGGNFSNNAGSGALTASGGGRWLVYSQNPTNDNRGGLSYNFKQYAATYGTTTVAQSTGNGFLYTRTPVLNIGLTGTVTKTYNGNTNAIVSPGNYTLSGGIDGDVTAVNITTSGTYANGNVGTSKAVTVSGLSLASATNGSASVYGYGINSTATANIGTINAATLTYNANTTTRTYGASNPAFTGAVTGFVGSDTLASATTGTAAFTSPATSTSNVGNYTVNGSGLTANNGNYLFSQALSNATALTINPAALTYTANAANRLYGSTNPSFAGTVTGFVNGETLSSATTGTASFSTPATSGSNVGTYAVNGSGLTANNGNYTFAQASSNATALTVGAVPLTYTADFAHRAYGANNPTFTGTVSGFVNGDTLASATTGSTAFTSTATAADNVGSYAVNGSGLTANHGNYTFAQATSNATALTIDPATLTYTANATRRIYGTSNPGLTGSVTGFVNGDTLASATTGSTAFTSTATAADNVGSYAVNGSGLTANHGNYTFAQATSNATALTIDPATLTYTANAANRTYGAGNPAFAGTVTGLVNGDTLASATAGTMAFTSGATPNDNVGSYAINGAGLSASNYTFAQAPSNATALTIDPASLTYTADSVRRVYGANNPSFTGTVTGFVNGDTLTSATTGTKSFTSAATASNPVGTYAVNGFGLTANHGNYSFTQAASNAAALTIDPATLTYVADANRRTYGASNPAFTGAVTGFVNGETLSSATTGTASFATTATSTSNVGSYAVTGFGVTVNNGNYTLQQAASNASALIIDPATLTYAADAANRTYGANNPTFTGTVTGLVNNDTLASATTGTSAFTSPATNTSNVGTYAINGSGLSATNYNFVQAAGNATALTINPATLTYTASSASRLYGASNPAFTGMVTGLVNGDTLASVATGTASFTSPAISSSNVGSYAINGSGLSATNYNFTQALGNASALTINAATLTYSASAANRLYGVSNPTFSGAVVGFVNSDTIASATTGTVSFTTTATTGSNVGTYAINGSGLSANHDNYTFTQAPGNTTALAINPATLTYDALIANRPYGTNNPAFTGTVTGFVNNDTLTSATTGTASYTTTATAGSNVGNYAINGSGLAANHGNYTFTQAAGNASALTIDPATLTYAADAANRTYGANNPTFTGTVTGLVNNDTLASATTGKVSFTSTATPTSNVGSYAINGSGLTANNGNYDFIQAENNKTALSVIAAAGLPVPPTQPGPPSNPTQPVSPPHSTVIALTVNNATRLANQPNPSFSVTYTGPAMPSVDMTALLSSLRFQTDASTTSKSGLYQITASGQVAGYTFDVKPGTLTVIDNSPEVIPTVANTQLVTVAEITDTKAVPPSSVAVSKPVTASVVGGTAAAPDTVGNFEMNYSSDWSKMLANSLKQSLAESSFLLERGSATRTVSTPGGLQQ